MLGYVIDESKISPFALCDEDVVDGEANTSIIAKISWKYRLKPAYVVKYVLQNEQNVSTVLTRDIAVSANSVTNKSLAVDQRLRFISGLAGLRGSYAHLRGFLDKGAHGLISEHKKWCAHCYAQSMAKRHSGEGARVSDQAYWSLDFSAYCTEHLCSLSDRCGKCYQRQPYISTTVEPGFCHYCYASLADAPSVVPEGDIERSKIQAQLLKYDIFYPDVTKPSDTWNMKSLSRNLRLIVDLCGDGGISEVALRCGVSEHTLKEWCAGRHGISLESLIKMLDGFGLSRGSGLFASSEDFSLLVGRQFSGHFNFRVKQSRRSVIPEISDYLNAVLSSQEKAISRKAIAERFGVSKGMLENAFKGEVGLVSKIYKQQQVADSLRVKDSLQYEMNRAVRRCGAKGRKLDWRHILAELQGIDLRVVRQRDMERAKDKAIKQYLESDRRDKSRDVEKLLSE